MSEWQPIETAPLNGTWVLLWWPYVTDAAFVGYCAQGVWHSAPDSHDETWSEGPTHWMPLPASPERRNGEPP